MVLKNTIRALFVVALLSSSAWAGLTGVTETFVVQRYDCPVKVRWRWKGDWKPYDQAIMPGMRVTGIRPLDKPDVVLFQLPGSEDFYAASWKCLFAKDMRDVERDDKTYSGWHLSMGLLSWTEHFDYLDANEVKHTIKANALGVCPGNGYLVRVERFDLGFSGCFAISQSFTTSQDPSITYTHRNLLTTSLIAGPLALWRPAAGNAAFGIYLPIMPRLTFWPQPDGVTVGKRIDYLFGAMAEIRVERKSWSISQRLGFLGSFKDVGCYFAFNKDFR